MHPKGLRTRLFSQSRTSLRSERNTAMSILQSLEVGRALFQVIKYRHRGLVVVQKAVMEALMAGFAGRTILEMK
jgi:hypothetical protein